MRSEQEAPLNTPWRTQTQKRVKFCGISGSEGDTAPDAALAHDS
jgi:hypothetical protein